MHGLLEFILKYAEIIKYSNETVGSYGKYMRTMSNEYITISNTGLDEIFEVLQNKKISFKRDALDEEIIFEAHNPDIKFTVEQESNGDYILTPNIDVFSYDILQGSSYIYMLTKKALYRCDKTFAETILKLLSVYRENYTPQIRFKREELPSFCSLVYPKLKDEISLDKLDESIICPLICGYVHCPPPPLNEVSATSAGTSVADAFIYPMKPQTESG